MSEMAFVPHPGSATDAVQKMEAASQPKPSAGTVSNTRSPQAVKTKNDVPQDGIYRTMVLQPGQARQLMPQDPNRARAVILSVDNPVILCETAALAGSPNNVPGGSGIAFPDGFYLSADSQITTYNKGLIWAVNTSPSATSRVSVLTERYENA